MNSLILSLLAAGCSSLCNLTFRKNGDHSTSSYSPSGYLLLFNLLPLISSFLFFPDIWKINVNFMVLAIGGSVGLLNSALMALTAQALKQGPSGLTFAFQNASAVFPGLILFLFLGPDFGFSCTYLQFVGMSLVLAGLFLGTKKNSNSSSQASSKWLTFALACFIVQILALTIIQGRCVLFDCAQKGGFFSSMSIPESDDIWFMPGQFGAAAITQAVLFIRERRKFRKSEMIYGCLGGITFFSSTCLLLLATKLALPFEKGILFPCFAVASMILCNIWANRLYKENFNYQTNALCSFGIFMAIP